MNIYSIKEIVEATNNILNPKEKNKINKKSTEVKIVHEIKNDEKPLVLKNEIIKNTENQINSINYKINIKPKIKDNMINELYLFLKKKVKKNTLKVIIDEQIKIKNLKNSINFLKNNKDDLLDKYKILENRYKFIIGNLNQSNKKNNELIVENNELKINNKELQVNLNNVLYEKKELIKQNDKTIAENKDLRLKNRGFEINNSELKGTISRYIVNSKKIQDKLNLAEKSKNFAIEEIENKIKFYQDENVRLSSELMAAYNKNENIKANLNDIESRKEKISEKIKELSKSIEENTNVISSTFIKEQPRIESNDLDKLNEVEQKSLDEVIEKIFKKI